MQEQHIFYQEAIEYYRSQRKSKWWRRLIYGSVLMAALGFGIAAYHSSSIDAPTDKNVLPVVRIGGEIGGQIDIQDLTVRLEKAFVLGAKNKTVVIAIDSPGGDPTLAQRIVARVNYFRQKNHGIKIIASCERMCASAAYMIAMSADEIISSPYALVGSIGAMIGTFNFSGVMNKIGVEYRAFGSGPDKTMLNPFLVPDKASEDKVQMLVERMGDEFVQSVRQRRKIDPSIPIGSGEVWTPQMAKEIGLIDRVAVIEDVAFQDLEGAIPVEIKSKSVPSFGMATQLVQVSLELIRKFLVQ